MELIHKHNIFNLIYFNYMNKNMFLNLEKLRRYKIILDSIFI